MWSNYADLFMTAFQYNVINFVNLKNFLRNFCKKEEGSVSSVQSVEGCTWLDHREP